MIKFNLKYTVGILFIGGLITSCNPSSAGEPDGHEHGEEEHGGHDEHGEEGTVTLTGLQMDAIGLKLVHIEKRNMKIGIQVTGKLELAPQDRADISPILGGIVKEINVIEGDKVKRGQVLASLEHPDFIQLQQDYINSVNTLEYLKKEYERQKRLYEEKVGSGKEFQKINAEYRNMKSVVKGLAIKLNMLGLNVSAIANGKIYSVVTIVSPMNGTISLVETNVGAYVEPLTKLFEVVNNDKLHADFRVYEKDINKVSVGQKVYFTTTSHNKNEFEGEIYAISPVFENEPKALHIHSEISSDKKGLIPGMYIQGRIIAENKLTMVLPEHAIVSEQGKTYIFVKTEGEEHNHEHQEEVKAEENHGHDHDHDSYTDEVEEDHSDEHGNGDYTFKMVEVMTGATSGGFVEIKLLESLAENSEIAGNGAYYLLAEMGKGETEHTH